MTEGTRAQIVLLVNSTPGLIVSPWVQSVLPVDPGYQLQPLLTFDEFHRLTDRCDDGEMDDYY